MNYKEFKTKLIEYIRKYDILDEVGIDLLFSESKIKKLYEYMNYILEKNKHINLTAIRNEEDFLKKHIVDSIYILKYIEYYDKEIIKDLLESKAREKKKRYLDVGTGGGFPLVPLKIILGYKSYGLDSILKKLRVINEKEQINMIHERAEKAAHDNSYRETFNLVTSRAVSNLENVIEYMAGFVKIDGILALYRGKKEEVDTAFLKKFGLKLVKVDTYKLFSEDRTMYIMRKVSKLSTKLPTTDSKIYKERSQKKKD